MINNNKPIKILQVSPGGTGSTILTNILQGLIQPDEPIYYATKYKIDEESKVVVIKTHNININKWIKTYENKYNIFFICSIRISLNKIMPSVYKKRENIIYINYEDLLEKDDNSIENIVNFVANKIVKKFNQFFTINTNINETNKIKLDINASIKRVENMNKCYENIKNKPFSYVDSFYQLHGSHRNRN